MKKVSIKPKPTTERSKDLAENWISSREVTEEEREELKRLTIDVPATLHKRIKTQCASRGLKMADEIRVLLEKNFPVTS